MVRVCVRLRKLQFYYLLKSNVISIFTCMSWAPQLSEFIYTVVSKKNVSANTCVTRFLNHTTHTSQNPSTKFSEPRRIPLRTRAQSSQNPSTKFSEAGSVLPKYIKNNGFKLKRDFSEPRHKVLRTQTQSSQNPSTKFSAPRRKLLKEVVDLIRIFCR
jgi:hypothetical protein